MQKLLIMSCFNKIRMRNTSPHAMGNSCVVWEVLKRKRCTLTKSQPKLRLYRTFCPRTIEGVARSFGGSSV